MNFQTTLVIICVLVTFDKTQCQPETIHNRHHEFESNQDEARDGSRSLNASLSPLDDTITTTTTQASTVINSGQIISAMSTEDIVSPSIMVPDAKQLFPASSKVIIDLSYPLDDKTLYWPSLPFGFRYESFNDGDRTNEHNGTYYLKSDGFHMAVHCGTHLDAPRHFSRTGWTVDEIPLERLVDVPVTVIDVSEKVQSNRSYSFQRSDFIHQDTNQSLVEPRSVVLMYTGISQSYSQGPKAYFGTEGSDMSSMVIPGFSGQAAEYLATIGVFGVGLDAPSADSSAMHGTNNTIDPTAHIIFNSNNIYILENISKKLADVMRQQTPMRLMIAPLPIRGGSGSPVRLVATSSHGESTRMYVSNSAQGTNSLPFSTTLGLGLFLAILISRQL